MYNLIITDIIKREKDGKYLVLYTMNGKYWSVLADKFTDIYKVLCDKHGEDNVDVLIDINGEL